MSAAEPHFCDDAMVVFRPHEAIEWTKRSRGEQFEITKRALRKPHRRETFGPIQRLTKFFRRDCYIN